MKRAYLRVEELEVRDGLSPLLGSTLPVAKPRASLDVAVPAREDKNLERVLRDLDNARRKKKPRLALVNSGPKAIRPVRQAPRPRAVNKTAKKGLLKLAPVKRPPTPRLEDHFRVWNGEMTVLLGLLGKGR